MQPHCLSRVLQRVEAAGAMFAQRGRRLQGFRRYTPANRSNGSVKLFECHTQEALRHDLTEVMFAAIAAVWRAARHLRRRPRLRAPPASAERRPALVLAAPLSFDS